MRTGTANLPLHGGKCPPWLFERMVKMSRALIEVMVVESGPDGILARLADPFWFQALGCVLGFDWHSSGLTTTVCGALKEALRDRAGQLGLFVAGGKGKTSRQTPGEILAIGEKFPLARDPQELVFASKMAAKVDNAAVQDGYQLYHHTFFFTSSGQWAIIQQGMNETTRWARRYHWLSTTVKDFVCEPHTAVCCDYRGETLNLVALESDPARKVIAELAREKPENLLRDLTRLQQDALNLPARHRVELADLNPARLHRVLLKSYERQPENFAALVVTEGVGPKALRALSLLSELAYGTPPSFRDPARFSFAHGGKDGHPYPVDRATYDHSIAFLEKALAESRLGRQEKIEAFRRLGRWPRHAF
ncbi:hypothetical protein SAMN02745219_01646 [Desulfofundulus thermosubterraneus DSM 16057]|uniref:DUF763 domain-containing protein n=1 Tax=Desulfofundulus thermosubterraneus DSM 16057 TaxID=1121432 RepID=A0A1M6G6A5_9FIRM|nr:DUF763 domain-containing protein [Desulfofundulus thermosubterraneus]SHJ05492.1 hypothetical protein SAMN02745219_01646 [Desulfofundulus thermosubterraneus DSM 16057]